jgi:hypothetical protein
VVLPGEAISNLLPAPLLPQQPVDPLQIASSEATVAARARSRPARALDGNARTLAAVPPGRVESELAANRAPMPTQRRAMAASEIPCLRGAESIYLSPEVSW